MLDLKESIYPLNGTGHLRKLLTVYLIILANGALSLLTKMPGVLGAKVDVKSGDVEVIAEEKGVDEQAIRQTIGTTNFKTISIKGPFKVKP